MEGNSPPRAEPGCWDERNEVVCAMQPVMDYVVSSEGEIVKIVDQAYEYTGMFVVEA